MTKEAGTLVGMEFWMRCPYCGDSSKNRVKAHFSVNLSTGAYHCHRCKASGGYSKKEIFEVTGQSYLMMPQRVDKTTIEEEDLDELAELAVRGPGIPRASRLSRWHFTSSSGRVFDLFWCRHPNGKVVGAYFRSSERKWSYVAGHRMLGFVGPKMISNQNYLRIVEGPYDVMYPEDVCTFGFPSKNQIQALAGFPLVLCPDGDVWEDPKLLYRYLLRFFKYQHILVLGAELIADGLDPDEVRREDRAWVSPKDLLRLWRKLDAGRKQVDRVREFNKILETNLGSRRTGGEW